MSLISKTNVALIADKDIICYKLVYPIHDTPIKYQCSKLVCEIF